ARFPLRTTDEDVVNMCGPDTYRVYALDEVGNVLDYITTLTIGKELRNARSHEHDVVAVAPSSMSSTAVVATARNENASDLRFALETVAQIAQTNGESLRAVAESQADWIKAI